MIRFIGSILDRIICTSMAILFAQAPAYVGQYEAVLTETSAELALEIRSIEEQAEENGEPVDVFLNRLAADSDSLLRAEGKARLKTLEIQQEVSQKLDTLRQVPEWKRPWTLYQTWDRNYDQAVDYRPLIPLNMTGLMYGFAGLLTGMLLAYLLGLLFKAIRGKKHSSLA